MDTKGKRKNYIGNIIKWAMIIIALVVVYFWKQEDINAAFREMRHHPAWVSILCLLATLLHFATEGRIISNMTMYEERQMTWWEGFKCGLYCAFYKLISLGSLSGIAEVYYISKHDIDPGKSSGIVLVQYAYQKLGVTLIGLISFIGLYLAGIGSIMEYAKWCVLGSVVSLTIVTILLIASAWKKFADFGVAVINKILKKKPEKAKKLTDQIILFNESGRYFFKHKTLCVRVTLLKMLKMALWYSVASIVVHATFPETNVLMPVALMAVSNMIGGVMVAPAGVGTLEFVVSLLFVPLFGTTAATVVILYRFYSMVVPFFIGAIVFAFDKKREKPVEKAEE